jgi:hypothetical protein
MKYENVDKAETLVKKIKDQERRLALFTDATVFVKVDILSGKDHETGTPGGKRDIDQAAAVFLQTLIASSKNQINDLKAELELL